MARKITKKSMYEGMLVVTSDFLHAQVRTISHIFKDSNMVEVQWMEGTNHCSQGVDYSLLMTPTVKQIEHSIGTFGPLVGINEILNY
jgi:hypothetical protein